MTREIHVLGVRPIHPGPREDSYPTLDVSLSYLRGEPVERIRLTEDELIRLIADAAQTLRIVREANDRKDAR